jgi:hypothetical protein
MTRFILLILAALLVGTAPAQAQSKFLTKNGFVSFFSASVLEDIEAKNQQVAAVLDLSTGQLAFSIPIKGFVFKRSLMQEHFNENYLESDKYPKATFIGRLVNFDAATLTGAGSRPVQVEGDLTMHGVTRRVQVPADYKVEIPALVRDRIAKVLSVRVALACNAVPATAAAPRSGN